MSTSAIVLLPKSRFPGVQTQTNGGPPAEAPSLPAGPCGPVGPAGPAGPAGPSTFQFTRVSLLWHAVPGPTRRMFPLPGLTHASSTAAGGGALAVTRASTINITMATKLRQA